nr:MAG TPA: hypothetical protein [Caudoviricetes sp.]
MPPLGTYAIISTGSPQSGTSRSIEEPVLLQITGDTNGSCFTNSK